MVLQLRRGKRCDRLVWHVVLCCWCGQYSFLPPGWAILFTKTWKLGWSCYNYIMWVEIFFSKLFCQFEQENEQLFEQMSSLVDEVRQIEGKVIEISRLQEVFADKVLQQVRGATLWMYWCEEYCTVNLYAGSSLLATCLWGWHIFEKNITTLENAPIPLLWGAP